MKSRLLLVCLLLVVLCATLAGSVRAQEPRSAEQFYRSAWLLNGNRGTDPANNFLGTTDNVALELRVNNARFLRAEPNAVSPNLIGGFKGNDVGQGVFGVTIGGGGRPGKPNVAQAPFTTIAGGEGNRAGGLEVGGTTVGGGSSNGADGVYSTIGGGIANWASGTEATIAGGEGNWNQGSKGTVGGGYRNVVQAYAGTVAGGQGNFASGDNAAVAGGENNSAGMNAAVGGGRANSAAGSFSSIGGGWRNAALGYGSSVPGGEGNLAEGRYAVALGRMARAQHDGTFVFNNSDDVLSSTEAGQIVLGAPGGLRVRLKSGDTSRWCLLEPSSVDWQCVEVSGSGGRVTVLKSFTQLKLEAIEAQNAQLRSTVAALEARVKALEQR